MARTLSRMVGDCIPGLAGSAQIAFRDLRTSPSSLQLLAYKIGAWHVRLNGTLADISLVRIINFLFGSTQQPAPLQTLSNIGDFERSSSPESEITYSAATKKGRGEGTAQKADGRKI